MLIYLAHVTEETHPPHVDANFWQFAGVLVLIILVGLWFESKRSKD